MSFFDFDNSKSSNQVEAKHNRDDLTDADNAPIICDNCPDGRVLIPYQQDKLICPNCITVYNPHFEHIKHDSLELTIDEEADINSGSISYVDTDKPDKIPPTIIRKKLDKDELPDYVKREVDHIQNRAGYYRHVSKADTKKLSSIHDKNNNI